MQTGIILQVNSNPTINVVLEVGQVADQIEVQADAALVETRSTRRQPGNRQPARAGAAVEWTQVTELILFGRGNHVGERTR